MTEARWPSIEYETLPWKLDPEERQFIPKSRRRKITGTYQAAVPPSIAAATPRVSPALFRRCSELAVELARFDTVQGSCGYRLPAVVLRSESAASSQIEHLTSSVRNVALAEISDEVPQNARLVAGNIAAMRQALATPEEPAISTILSVHKALIEATGESFGGNVRSEQVWIGGTPYSPHGALFVPPSPMRVMPLLQDLVGFCLRDDIEPIMQAALAHAQFETIHPFIDGNGRTGRVLIHKQLAYSKTLSYSTLPISAGLLHDTQDYMNALDAYHDGEIAPIVGCLCSALETALRLGVSVLSRVDEILGSWEDSITERAGSKMHLLPALLVEQPVVNAAFVSKHLGISERASRDLLAKACEYGFVEQAGNKRRGRFFQAPELLEVLESMSSEPAIRRTLSQ